MLLGDIILFGSLSIFLTVASEEQSTNNVGELLLAYESYINASLTLDKSDRVLLNTWTTDFQVKQVNITSHYRLEMTRQNENTFRAKTTNPKWKDCMSLHANEINNCKSSYVNSEGMCLRTANSDDKKNIQGVRQVEKEIRKWRKSYKYLSSICNTSHPDDQDATALCLVEYIKRDNYDVVLQRLIILKLEAMEHVLLHLNQALSDLEECLKASLSQFLNTVRKVMARLNTCYSIINKQ